MGAVKPVWVLFFIFVFCLLFTLPDQVFAGTVGIRKVGTAKLCYLKRWGKKGG